MICGGVVPKITGDKGVSRRLGRIAGKEKVAFIGRALFAAGGEIKTEAQISLTTGAVSGKFHQPSAAGSPPNNDTGVLAAHITATQPAPLRVQVSSSAGTSDTRATDLDGKTWGPGRKEPAAKNLPYAVLLEYGTSNMLARPYMGPAARKKRKRAQELVAKAMSLVTSKKG